jgi:hypothetical protein
MKSNSKRCRNCDCGDGKYEKSRANALLNKRRRNRCHNRCDTDKSKETTGWNKDLKDHHEEANKEQASNPE